MNEPTWPTLQPAAYHGVLGEIVKRIEPQTEADPVGILIQLLVMLGNLIGPTPRFYVGRAVHRFILYTVLVGTTAKGRKGMSRDEAQYLLTEVDPAWAHDCIATGLSSGEGLIHAIRDPIEKDQPIKEQGDVVGYTNVVVDQGIADKRLCVIEPEFASPLKMMGREGNNLSEQIRNGWDCRDFRSLVKNSPFRSTGPHVSIIGHITSEELRRQLGIGETSNGFANRFLWTLVKRSKLLPHGGKPVRVDDLVRKLSIAVHDARRVSEVRRDDAADRMWEQAYPSLSADRIGLLGAMTARAEAQVMRLSGLYALADGSPIVRVPHLTAAFACWRYCFQSVGFLFGDRLGDYIADPILGALRRAWPESMSRTEISALFMRHRSVSEIDRGLDLLKQMGLARVDTDRAKEGRPTERWYFTQKEINDMTDCVLPDEGRRPRTRPGSAKKAN